MGDRAVDLATDTEETRAAAGVRGLMGGCAAAEMAKSECGSFPLLRASRWNVLKVQGRAKLVRAVEKLRRRKKKAQAAGGAPQEGGALAIGGGVGGGGGGAGEMEEGGAIVLVGPVIGLVTENSARILLEVSKPARVRMSLQRVEEDEEAEDDDGEEGREMEEGTKRRKKGNSKGRTKLASSSFSSTASTSSSSSSSSASMRRDDGGGLEEDAVEKEMAGRRACVFAFAGLRPAQRYRVSVGGCRVLVPRSAFRTFPPPLPRGSEEPPSPRRFRMASISCNSIFITTRTLVDARPIITSDLWSHLTGAAPHLDLIVHLGDQIYGDGDPTLDAGAGKDLDKWSNRFKIAQRILEGVAPEERHTRKEVICEKYREVYRDTWGHMETATSLANCPNLMIYDDHEIRDNWGDNPSDKHRDSAEFFIARCAWLVTMEYQRQLFEDVDFSKYEEIDKDYHFHVIGEVGLMFLDIRASRTFHRVEGDGRPYLGSRQWKDIRRALKADGLFQHVRALVVCSPAPLAFLVPSITKFAGKSVERLEDFKGHWSAHNAEQVKMIERLQQWKSSGKGRDVLFLGGDVHCGGHSRILKDSKTLFYQLTTSPIANMPLPKTAYYAMRIAGQLGRINDHITFSHFNWTRARNYGIIDITFQDEEKTEIITQLIKGKFMRPIRMGKRVSNMQERSSRACDVPASLTFCKRKLISMVLTSC